MNENIHEIARSYGYNDIGMFDPYMCYSKYLNYSSQMHISLPCSCWDDLTCSYGPLINF